MTEGPGLKAFALSDGTVYHTYSTTNRGLEPLMAYYGVLRPNPVGQERG
jgi:predicted dithiol-disulfide oxidoreductase (DUF899 family)